ncbi:DUF6919 domain-containing protein [Pseudarthrobacter sp. N5]|uniref:DUF6919 domain-containing protein n=1 Tax=Pseudarthrobacter sp. N5 TaxID=3418416 RepID=UPI003CF27FDA
MTVAHAPGERSSSSIPVTLDRDAVVTVLGSSESPIEPAQLQDWSDETNESLALLLADAWYVKILDPVWGRNHLLLPAILESLNKTK